MPNKVEKMPVCSRCGKCCVEGGSTLVMTPSDHQRWKREGRWDILRYAWVGPIEGHGDLWIDIETGEELSHCPFLKEVSSMKFACGIYDTRPKVCKGFWCEWSYGGGRKGVPFKKASGWSEKARELGYR